MDGASVRRTSVEAITGECPFGVVSSTPTFPAALGPLGLAAASKLVLSLTASKYTVVSGLGALAIGAKLEQITGNGNMQGPVSPRAKLPENWPGAPAGATSLCWAYPLGGIAQFCFLAITTSPALMFAAYGGFLLLDDADNVLAVQAIAPEEAESGVAFEGPRKWRSEFTTQLKEAKRFQPVTLPFMRDAGAREFCWINPAERLLLGSEAWTPSDQGAFLYLMADGEASYFPADLTRAKTDKKEKTTKGKLGGKGDGTEVRA